jgi:hypothetical protein
MKNYHRALAVVLMAGMLFSSCSMLTESGRRERAYERYVRKSSHGRNEQQKRSIAQKQTVPALPGSGEVVSTEVDGPESLSSGVSE